MAMATFVGAMAIGAIGDALSTAVSPCWPHPPGVCTASKAVISFFCVRRPARVRAATLTVNSIGKGFNSSNVGAGATTTFKLKRSKYTASIALSVRRPEDAVGACGHPANA